MELPTASAVSMKMKRRSILTLLASLPVSAACGEAPTPRRPAREQLRAPHLSSTLIEGVPHVKQKPDFCGEAAVAAFLGKLGKAYDQDDVFALTGMDPSRGMGATTRELAHALERIGFDTGPVWHHVDADHADAELAQLFDQLHTDLKSGVPSIVCTHYDDRPDTTEHFRLVLGYDAGTDEVIYHEPAESGGAYKRMKRDLMLRLWPLKYEAQRWTVIRMRLAPGKIAAPPRFDGHSPADFAQHVRALRKRVGRGFAFVVEQPFVVVGDGSAALVRKRAAGTVRWAVNKLKAAYFDEDPRHIIDVFLLEGEKSYRHHAWRLFRDEPDTPYGYYSRDDRAMVMNIATGGGTLVHEIVHPFIEANFPSCPAWFNEGLGSLYEQSAERDGRIVGLTNWRLAGLQRAIRNGVVPSFEKLTHTSTHAFYAKDPGTNYAQARYLLFYLQERKQLRRYYRAFVKNRAADPTGYGTLKQLLGTGDMMAFKKTWERYVLSLRFG
jgi:hypothetical protein